MSEHDHEHGSARGAEMGFAIASGVTYALGAIFEYFVEAPIEILPTVFFLATYFFGGFFTIGTAIRSIRHGRFEVDFLMLVAALGAASIGKFAEGAVLLFLFSLGHALEEYAMGRAKRSIEALAELAPAVALVRDADNTVREVPTEELQPGMIVIVRPNSRIPADGVVVDGTSAVDQSAITGESIPVDKRPAPEPALRDDTSRVFAGTVNGAGALDVEVTSAAEDSTLARVIAMVRDADESKSATQKFIDRFQKYYVPTVIVLVALVFGIGWAVTGSVSGSFYRAMLVLVAASPCALAIATPAAVLAGVARAARAGLLVKGGGPLENLGRVSAIAFDKTGTLTWGRPRVADIVPMPGATDDELVRTAFAVESVSDHPLAAALTRDLADRIPADARPEATDVQAVTGRGVTGSVDGNRVLVGSPRLFADESIPLGDNVERIVDELQRNGRTVMIVRSGDRFLGVLGVMDTPRGEAGDTLRKLSDAGVAQMVMISGDNQRVADAVGSQIGVDRAMGDLLPEDKVDVISTLSRKSPTAMIGDGVNDAPAMATATVGVAMGAAGSAVALDTADVALMSDDIGRIPFLIRLSRASSRIIRQNLIAALAIVAVLIPASLLGLAMGPVVFIHEGSTLLVIANALRLLRYDVGKEHAGIEHEAPPSVTAR